MISAELVRRDASVGWVVRFHVPTRWVWSSLWQTVRTDYHVKWWQWPYVAAVVAKITLRYWFRL
jgi:hypothetical protein